MAKSKKARTLSKQAHRGIPEAQYALGLCYYEGKGVAKDERKGVEWIREAALQGYKPAKDWMEDYAFDDDPGVQAES
ncbi:MAG: SEL1-like repeat protein [Bacilli bacterium]|nr:SEL1-like repeat protein [Bacilli bacterium]